MNFNNITIFIEFYFIYLNNVKSLRAENQLFSFQIFLFCHPLDSIARGGLSIPLPRGRFLTKRESEKESIWVTKKQYRMQIIVRREIIQETKKRMSLKKREK